MNFKKLINRNISYFIRYYRLISIAVFITVAVIVGSLVVGDSVRTTLINRVSERLGDTETIIFSRNSFMSEELIHTAPFNRLARGILLTNGFISQNGKLIPVIVWGTDDMAIAKGTAKINASLEKEIGQSTQTDIVLRLPATGLVPSGSLFVTENYTTGLRLFHGGIVSPREGGNVNMKNEQTIPLNIFINRTELAETMGVEGKINLILSGKTLTADEVEKAWNYKTSGLSVSYNGDFTEITSDRVFLQKEVVESVAGSNTHPNRLFSYLANGIELNNTSIPYSFVTAIDRYKGELLEKHEIILSDYSARRLQAKAGDKIKVSYFTSQDLKTLQTKLVELRVKKIVPIAELQEDKSLSTDFPGLSDVERCTDWDSDLPINMDLITDEDEKYWEQYRSTPKALIAYEAIVTDWSNAYGNATAIRITDSVPDLGALRSEMFGIQLIYPREAGIYAAKNGVDFSSLFLALGFFIIISAMLLILIPLSEMLYQRRYEFELLGALGFTRKRIIRILWRETAPVVLLSSIAGVIGGLLYTTLIIWLLGNIWKGATHTDGFSVYPSFITILIGFLVGIILSLWLLRCTIARHLKRKQSLYKRNQPSLGIKKWVAILFTLLVIIIITVNLFIVQSITLFVVTGVILIVAAALWVDYIICLKGSVASIELCSSKLVWRTLYAGRKQSILSFFTLAIGVFIVFSVGLNRRGFSDSSQLRVGTGGYSLWCESTVPVYHNMATAEGRAKLSLTDLPAETELLQCLRLSADDASCLNLNKVITPTVLGVDINALHPLLKNELSNKMQVSEGNIYPALVDATVLTWSLMKNIGDTLWYEGDRGQTVGLRLVGTLPNTIFQGNVLINRNHFSTIWEETTGSEVFLLKVEESQKEPVKNLLSQALNEYGVRVSTTNDRLREFNTVTDTYLTIFLTLGGLGLLLGIMSFIIVVRKNLAMRYGEINLYHTLGFTNNKIERILHYENLLVPLYAIVTGIVGSLVGVSTSFMNASVWVWFTAFLFTVFFVACLMISVKKLVRKEIIHSINI